MRDNHSGTWSADENIRFETDDEWSTAGAQSLAAGSQELPAREDRAYHRDRARAELDMAYRAAGREAAEAHLRLSALHMRRLEALRTS